jgi:hypothetical protein
MRTSVRYAIAILVSAIIPIAALTHNVRPASATPQTEPDYRSRTIYFLLADRFNPHHLEPISSIVLPN